MRHRILRVVSISALALASTANSGCATQTGPLSTDQKIANCVMMIGAGAILGAIIGNNTGSGNADTGAGLGAVAGGGACAVWMGFQSQKDKEYMLRAQLQAASQGTPVAQSWTGDDGRVRSVVVTPSTTNQMIPVDGKGKPAVSATPRLCRNMNTQAQVANASDSVQVIWCRDDSGDWAPATQNMTAVS